MRSGKLTDVRQALFGSSHMVFQAHMVSQAHMVFQAHMFFQAKINVVYGKNDKAYSSIAVIPYCLQSRLPFD